MKCLFATSDVLISIYIKVCFYRGSRTIMICVGLQPSAEEVVRPRTRDEHEYQRQRERNHNKPARYSTPSFLKAEH